MQGKWLGIGLSVFVLGAGCIVQPATTTGPAVVGGGANASITIQNMSNYDIYQLYMSSSADPNWGPDQLGSNILSAGGSTVTLTMPCGTYDIKVVDEDNDECTMMGQTLCSNAAWYITNEELLSCEGYR